MTNLPIGLLVTLAATNQLMAATNVSQHTNTAAVAVTDTNSPVEQEFKKLEDMDDDAQAEVDKWIRDNQAFAAKGAGAPDAELNQRIRARLEPVRKAYEDFIAGHPNHAGVRLAYGSFLHDLGDEEAGEAQVEKARELDPKNPAVWNNLANYYSESGKVKTAFEYYAKAIELNPNEPLYYYNLGNVVSLFRKDAMEFYKITEQQVFDKALELYAKAFKLDPQNFNLATDLAQTHYGIRPTRTDDALKAWTNALAVAHDEIEREGVYIHFARFKWLAGRTNEARDHLNAVTNEMYAELKKRIARNLDAGEKETKGTNGSPVTVEKK
ncbi:MAG: tetratricopeptide repeat protein [Verrucomicrobiota bacterium]